MPIGRHSKRKAGVIGLGNIGTHVAANLRHKGFQTFVWNRTAKAEPNFLGSPGEVAKACEVVQMFVSDADAVLEMIDAMGKHLTSRHIVVCNATIGREGTLVAAKKTLGYGAAFLDAPFTGSKLAAEHGQLVYYIGGEDEVLVRARPNLEASGKAVVRIGAIGDAALVKVVTNMIIAAVNQGLAEALAIVRKAGIPEQVLIDAVQHNAVRSGIIDLKLPKMIDGDFEPHFALKHMQKDVRLALQLASQFGLQLPAAETIASTLKHASNHGWENLDFSVIAKLYETQTPPIVAQPETVDA